MSFEVWLLWGIPLVIVFVLAAWAVLAVSFRLWNYNNDLVHITFPAEDAFHPVQKWAVRVTVVFFLLFILLSSLMKTSAEASLILFFTVMLTGILVVALFFLPFPVAGRQTPLKLLRLQDCYSDLPWRGFGFLVMITLLLGGASLLHIQDYMMTFFRNTVRQEFSPPLLFLIIAALTSFSTELLSNTVVQVAMFLVATPLFGASSMLTIQAFLIITLSCTSAFMTPIATGVNGLAFGEMKGISLLEMLGIGLLMKFVSILLIAFGVPFIFGWLL